MMFRIGLMTVLAACNKDGAEGFLITAADGGTVEVEGAKLRIPAGALAEDTTITVELLDAAGQPSEGDIVATVYDFGPDGLTFLEPVSLEIEATLPSDLGGRTPVVAWSDGAAWTAVPSTTAGSTITGSIDHFTPFTVVLTGDTQTGGTCETETYAACGGDLTGTWSYSAGCATLKESPPMMCDEATFTLTVDLSGTVTFGSDGTYSAQSTLVTTTTMRVPKSCLPAPGIACGDIDDEWIDDGDACVATETQEPEEDDDSGTYTTAGNTVTFDPEDPESDGAQEYCVSGDTLTILYRGEDADVLYTATRQ